MGKYWFEPKSDETRLAFATVCEMVIHSRILPVPDPIPDPLRRRAACFVTLYHEGDLAGCIGTVEPYHDNLAEEIIHNAAASATRDWRFEPVRPEMLERLTLKVDVLSPIERISGPDQLDVKRYGVVVEHESRRGLLLPDIEGITSVPQQIEIALRKAGINPSEPYRLSRFEVERKE